MDNSIYTCDVCGEESKPRAMTAPKPETVSCAVCGEESGAKGSSMYGSVHKYGPTDHHFEPTMAEGPFGTRWVAAGEGATRWQLETALQLASLEWFGVTGSGAMNLPSNLALTGSPLTAADLERIARCEVAK